MGFSSEEDKVPDDRLIPEYVKVEYYSRFPISEFGETILDHFVRRKRVHSVDDLDNEDFDNRDYRILFEGYLYVFTE
jgi:hypothetical protein